MERQDLIGIISMLTHYTHVDAYVFDNTLIVKLENDTRVPTDTPFVKALSQIGIEPYWVTNNVRGVEPHAFYDLND